MDDDLVCVTVPASVEFPQHLRADAARRHAADELGYVLSVLAVSADVVTFYAARADLRLIFHNLRQVLGRGNPSPRRLTVKGPGGHLDLRLAEDTEVSADALVDLIERLLG